MKRRAFITLLVGAASAWPLTARAQQGERMRRIGALTSPREDAARNGRPRNEALRQGAWSNWAGARAATSDRSPRWGEGKPETMRKNVTEIPALAPDIVVVTGARLWRRCLRQRAPCRSCS